LKINNKNIHKHSKSVYMTLLILCISFFPFKNNNNLQAQNINNNIPLQVGIYTANAGWYFINHQWEKNLQPNPQTWTVPVIDKAAVYNYNSSAVVASDASIGATLLLSGLQCIDGNKIDWQHANLLAQNLFITANLTQSVKLSFQRNRPYTQGANGISKGNDDFYSFFSGHSSVSAAAATTGLWVAYHTPSSQAQKTMAWTAAGLSLTTGVLRIAAGKHYPSDVLVGWIVGSGVALLNGVIFSTSR
jgi:membrane-associated phospholipid phosphatase